MPVRYKKAPSGEQRPRTFLDGELQRIETALRNIDADTITTKLGNSLLSSQVVVQAPGTTFFPPLKFATYDPQVVIQYGQAAGAIVFNALTMDSFAANINFPAFLNFRKTSNDTLGGIGATANNEYLGVISFSSSDATAFRESARIAAITTAAATGGGIGSPAKISQFVAIPGTNTLYEGANLNPLNPGTQFNVFDSSANFLATMGTVNTHGGFAAAATNSTSYSLIYFYSQNFGAIRGYVGCNNGVMEVHNATVSQEMQIQHRDSGNAIRNAIRIGGAVAATAIAFHNATPIVKPTATGAKGGNAALASICTILANYGLIVDSTT